MARPIPLQLPKRDPRQELKSRLDNAPVEHAEAVLAAYEVIQGLYDRGVLDLVRGALSAGDRLLEIVVDEAKSPEAIHAIRNLFLFAKVLGTVEPELLKDFTMAIPKALAQANAEEARPPGFIKLVSTFSNRDFRRGLAGFNDLLVAFGKNLSNKNDDNNGTKRNS
jgi:uncharacterized protein YjgD (DUF1641 family)